MLQRPLLKLLIYVRNRPMLPFLVAATVALTVAAAFVRLSPLTASGPQAAMAEGVLLLLPGLCAVWLGQWRRGFSLRLLVTLAAIVLCARCFPSVFHGSGDWLSPVLVLHAAMVAGLALVVRGIALVQTVGASWGSWRYSVLDALEWMFAAAIASGYLSQLNWSHAASTSPWIYLVSALPWVAPLATFAWQRSAMHRAIALAIIATVATLLLNMLPGVEPAYGIDGFWIYIVVTFGVVYIWLAGVEVRRHRRGQRPARVPESPAPRGPEAPEKPGPIDLRA